MQLAFGPGAIWGTPLTSNPTPTRLALAKSSGLSFSSQIKGAYGESVFAKALGRGSTTVKGTMECEALSLRTISDLFLNGTAATGATKIATDETGTIPATPYQVTVSNNVTWTVDLGVKFTATGVRLVRVASGPTTGQYSCAAGVYTFAAADTLLGVRISYKYTATAGETITLNNYLQGCPNPYAAVLLRQFQSTQEVITLNNVLSDAYDDTAAQDAFTSPKLTFQAATDDSDVLGTISMGEYQ